MYGSPMARQFIVIQLSVNTGFIVTFDHVLRKLPQTKVGNKIFLFLVHLQNTVWCDEIKSMNVVFCYSMIEFRSLVEHMKIWWTNIQFSNIDWATKVSFSYFRIGWEKWDTSKILNMIIKGYCLICMDTHGQKYARNMILTIDKNEGIWF